MKQWLKALNLYLALSLITPLHLYGAPQSHAPVETKKRSRKRISKKTFPFRFINKSLIDVINTVAERKGVNIVLPVGADEIKNKVTITIEEKISLGQAWNLLLSILDTAGYSMLPKGTGYIIVKTSKEVARNPSPIYINVPYQELPDNVGRISYIYYLANIKISEQGDSELTGVLQEILPPEAKFKTDQQTNGVLITAPANVVRAAMKIITALDKTGFQESLEIFELRHSSAEIVAQLFNENILKTAGGPRNRFRLDTKAKNSALYFSQNIRLIPITRTNSIMMLGREQAVSRVKNFIYKYIDVELESGKSILHIYQLQYLNAEEFAPVLERIVQSAQKGSGQSKAGAQAKTERFFDGVIIKTDSQPSGKERKGGSFGGNKLIIAARNNDWRRIKKLIEELDTPQPQVIIEVLVADLTLRDSRILGSLTRNHKDIPIPEMVNFQAAHAGQVIVDDGQDPTTINADLLRKAFDDNGNFVTDAPEGTNSLADTFQAGSTVISLSDNCGSTYSVLQMLKLFDNSKILSHPHIIATNNQSANVYVGEKRLVDDAASSSSGGTTTVNRKYIDAKLELNITPRISTDNSVNLDVRITINEFIGQTGANRITREVTTNANVKNKDVLALGGLVRTATENDASETPILSKVPILGWFFKKRSGDNAKTSLMVFISPTIILPRVRGGVGDYTKDYIKITKKFSQEGALFDTLRDPVTRWFFKTDSDASEAVDEFVQRDEFKNGDILQSSKPRRHPENLANNKTRTRKKRTQKTHVAHNKKPVKKSFDFPEPPKQKPLRKEEQLRRLLEDEDNPFDSLV